MVLMMTVERVLTPPRKHGRARRTVAAIGVDLLRALGLSVGLALLSASSGLSQERTVERILRDQRVDVAERGWMGLSSASVCGN